MSVNFILDLVLKTLGWIARNVVPFLLCLVFFFLGCGSGRLGVRFAKRAAYNAGRRVGDAEGYARAKKEGGNDGKRWRDGHPAGAVEPVPESTGGNTDSNIDEHAGNYPLGGCN